MDTIEITLPVSKSKVVIRNYTTRADDERAEAILYSGVSSASDESGKSKIQFPVANLMESNRSYIEALVETINGEKATPESFSSLRTADYEAVEKEVSSIVEENSPKAKEAKKASKSNTKEK